MCVYCATADDFFRGDKPPVWPWPDGVVPPFVPVPNPAPQPGYEGWDIDNLKELLDILQKIKTLEDNLRICPCTPSKADYLKLLRERIEKLEAETEVCEECHRRYKKPLPSNHNRIECLESQLADLRAERTPKLEVSH